MPSPFIISALKPDNTQAIEQAAIILTDAFHEHWPDAWPTHEEAVQEVTEMTAEDRISLAAFDPDGNVIGWIGGISEYDGNVWELHPLAVKPDMQQQGVGRALVQAFEREVKQRGGLTVRLGSDDEDGMTSLSNVNLYEDLWDKVRDIQNIKGHPYEFYQKLGYTIIGIMPDANGRGKPDIIMGKQIS
jgi:aminoglycoside 6'-N-acetyltransferase I